MPRAEQPADGALLDIWGRKNRALVDRECPVCSKTFRPLRSSSKFCSRPCMWSQNGGKNRLDAVWWVSQKGYIVGRIWENGKQRAVKQHRYFLEQHIGRRLASNEDVHHINGIKTDNRIENLQIINHCSHATLSNHERWKRAAIADAITRPAPAAAAEGEVSP